MACVGLVLLSQLDAASSDGYLVWCLLVTGVGQGLFMAPNTRAIMGAAPPGEQGIASSTLATVRVIGQSLSVALGGAVFASLGGAAAGTTLSTQRAALTPEEVTALQRTFTTGLHAALLVCAAVAAGGVLAALVRGQEDLARQEPPASSGEPVRSQT